MLNKAREVWVWIALCRKTRQVVAYALGDRSTQTCLRLWEAIVFQVGGDATPACLLLFLHRYNLDKTILLK